MSTTAQTAPDPDDRTPVTAPSASEPYWRQQLWQPAYRRDTAGMLADLIRHLLTRLFHVRWRLTVQVGIDADIDAPTEEAASHAFHTCLHAADTLIVLSHTDLGAVPPWWSLAVTDRPPVYVDHGPRPAGSDPDGEPGPRTWRCSGNLLVTSTVDVAEAGWANDRYTVDVVPGIGQPRPYHIGTDPVWVHRREPVRRGR